MSFIIKFALGMVKQKIDTVVKNLYFKLSANNKIFSILEKFFLENIENNFKANALFFYSPIKKTSSIQKVNIANSDKNRFNIISLAAKRKNYCHSQNTQRESQRRNLYIHHIQSKNNIANRYSFDNNSGDCSYNNDSDFVYDLILKSYQNYCQNKAFIATISLCIIVYT